jgi:Tfp pilus assembly protein PilO
MNNKKFIITIILIFLLNGAALAGWLYLFSNLKKQNNFIKEEQQKILVSDKKLENSNSLKTLMNEIIDEKQKIDSVFLDKDSVVNFIENLESIAGKTGASIKIGNINIDSQKKKGLSLQFNLTGNFNQLFHYLILVEKLPYLINIETMDFKKSASNEWEADFEILVNSFIGT